MSTVMEIVNMLREGVGIILVFVVGVAIFYFRVKHDGGWWPLGREKIQTIFGKKTDDE